MTTDVDTKAQTCKNGDMISSSTDGPDTTTTVIYDPESATWTVSIATDDMRYPEEFAEGESIEAMLSEALEVFEEDYHEVVVGTQNIAMTGSQWCDVYGLDILDPDGWDESGVDWLKPIGLKDFVFLAKKSNVDALSSDWFSMDLDNVVLNGVTV